MALDTASPVVSVAAARPSGVIAERREELRRSSVRLLGMIDEVLAEAGVRVAGLAGVVVLAGPGSFTGLRVGLATALGLHQATGVAATAVPTLGTLARVAASLLHGDRLTVGGGVEGGSGRREVGDGETGPGSGAGPGGCGEREGGLGDGDREATDGDRSPSHRGGKSHRPESSIVRIYAAVDVLRGEWAVQAFALVAGGRGDGDPLRPLGAPERLAATELVQRASEPGAVAIGFGVPALFGGGTEAGPPAIEPASLAPAAALAAARHPPVWDPAALTAPIYSHPPPATPPRPSAPPPAQAAKADAGRGGEAGRGDGSPAGGASEDRAGGEAAGDREEARAAENDRAAGEPP